MNLLFFFCLFGIVSNSFGLARPEVQSKIEANYPEGTPIGDALAWDWCDPALFDQYGLGLPWEENARRGVNLAQTTCSELKSSWELYDRYFTTQDRDAKLLKIAPGAVSVPYFALYNRYTGVLRAFLYVNDFANSASTGDYFIVRTSITQGGDIQEPTHLLDFHTDGLLPSLQSPRNSIQKLTIIPEPDPNVWVIVDIPLMYDPSDYIGPDGYEKQLYIHFKLELVNESELQIGGSLNGELNSINSGNVSSLSAIKGAISDAVVGYNNITDLSKDLNQAIEKNKFNFLSPANIDKLSTFSSILGSYGNVGAALLTGGYSFFNRYFNGNGTVSTSYLNATLTLNGNITDKVHTLSYSIPYSGSILTNTPLFAYKHPRPDQRKLGLFHFTRWKGAYVSKKYVANGHYDETLILGRETPSCLLAVNPNSLGKLVDEAYGQGDAPIYLTQDAYPQTNLIAEYKTLTSIGSTAIGLSFRDPTTTNVQRQVDFAFRSGVLLAPESALLYTSQLSSYTGQSDRSYCMDQGQYSAAYSMAFWDFPQQFTLGAVSKIKLNDRARVIEDENTNTYGDIYTHGLLNGASPGQIELGADAIVGGIFANNSDVFLRDRSVITRKLVATNVTQQNNVYAPAPSQPSTFSFPQPVGMLYFFRNSSTIPPNTYLPDPLSHYPGIEVRRDACVTSPGSENTSFNAQCQSENGKNVLRLTPGVYGNLMVRDGASLVLEAGFYWFRDLWFESGSEFSLDSRNGSTIVQVANIVSWRANIKEVDPTRLLMVYFGEHIVNLTTPFYGTFLAPASMIEMGRGWFENFYGRFYGRSIEIHQNTRIVHENFSF